MRRPTPEDPSKTGIYLTGINETFTDFYEIELFYDLLDQHRGIDINNSGIKPSKPQVAGVIHINNPIPYRKYTELTARYPDVKIEAPEVICTVIFESNDIDMPTVINVAQGTTIGEIPTPVKPSTQAHYYEFEN
jgi:hypothetical protein